MNFENRLLARFPKTFDENGFNWDFSKGFDVWLSDNFAMRAYYVTANSMMYYKIFGESQKDRVIAGKEGWLYFGETLDDYLGRNRLTDEQINDITATLSLCNEYVKAQGKSFLFFAAPNKNTIYPDFMPKRYLRTNKPTNMERLYNSLAESSVDYVDLAAVLKRTAAENEEILYHKKDSHWNNLGAKIGYSEIMNELEKQIDERLERYDGIPYEVQKSHAGDLTGMFLPMLDEKDEQFIFGIENIYESKKPIVRLDDMEIVTTAEKKGARALMFRDSFANALIPFMSNQFKEITYTRAVPYNFTNQSNVDIVMLEIVERNLPELLNRTPIVEAAARICENPSVSSAEQLATDKAKIFSEEKNGMTYIYGYFEYEHGKGNEEILLEFETSLGMRAFAAFPIADERIRGEADGMKGFSLYVKEPPIKDGVVIQYGGKRIFVKI